MDHSVQTWVKVAVVKTDPLTAIARDSFDHDHSAASNLPALVGRMLERAHPIDSHSVSKAEHI